MKTRVILGMFLLLALCVRANGGNGYLTIPNRFGDKVLLPDFRDYKNESDSIAIEKVFFRRESNDSLFLIGNIAGGKSSLIVAIDKKKPEILFCAESAKIDTVTFRRLRIASFFVLSSRIRICAPRRCAIQSMSWKKVLSIAAFLM